MRLRTVTGHALPHQVCVRLRSTHSARPRPQGGRGLRDFPPASHLPAHALARLRSPRSSRSRERGGSRASRSLRACLRVCGPGRSERIAAPSAPRPPTPAKPTPELAHASADATASPQAGRAWATSQLTFNAGQFESVLFGYADYARDGENEAQLRSRVHEVVLAEVEQQVRAVRALHERLGDRGVGSAFVRPSAARS